jgi:hypothetical protein
MDIASIIMLRSCRPWTFALPRPGLPTLNYPGIDSEFLLGEGD